MIYVQFIMNYPIQIFKQNSLRCYRSIFEITKEPFFRLNETQYCEENFNFELDLSMTRQCRVYCRYCIHILRWHLAGTSSTRRRYVQGRRLTRAAGYPAASSRFSFVVTRYTWKQDCTSGNRMKADCFVTVLFTVFLADLHLTLNVD